MSSRWDSLTFLIKDGQKLMVWDHEIVVSVQQNALWILVCISDSLTINALRNMLYTNIIYVCVCLCFFSGSWQNIASYKHLPEL